MIDSKNYIGSDSGTHYFQNTKDGMIRGFNGYCVVETVDGQTGMECVEWTHSIYLNGLTYKSGMPTAPTIEMPEELDGLYEMNTFSCEECCARHDSDAYGNDLTYTIVNECEVYCLECVNASDLLIELDDAKNLFKAKNVQSVNLDGYEEIDTLFCDSSGMGSSFERALTMIQAKNAASKLISDSSEPLYAGITGIGQFQVYVSIFRKVA